jgi:acyl-CoA reductase-like NAD-dependent aldehyde dehydrogenase
MGTIISHDHLARIDGFVKRASKTASVITGGQRMTGSSQLDGFDFSRGAFYPPTVLTDVNTEDEIWREEVFGPVVVIRRFMVDIFLFFSFEDSMISSAMFV